MEVSPNRARFDMHNKYLRYREEYERARDFSKQLDTAQVSKPEKSASPEKAKPVAKEKIENTESQKKPELASKNLQNTRSPMQEEASPPVQASLNIPNTGAASDRMIDKVKEYEPAIRAAAARYDLPPELIAGVIWQESRGNPRAVSHCGAMGMMQLMPATAANLGVNNAFDPIQNIDGGAKYLRQMYDKFGRVDFAVAAYNSGPGNVAKFNGIPPFKETQDYVPKVLGFANSFRVANAFAQTTPSNAVRV